MGKAISDEKWLPIPGYEGFYEVSNFGRVKSLPRTTTHGGLMKLQINSRNGYVYVCLSQKNERKYKRVHKAVLEAFCPRHEPCKCQIDHIDGNKTNNSLCNLEWVSQSENIKRAFEKRQIPKKKVIDLDTLEVFDSLKSASDSVGGKWACAIGAVCRGERRKHKGHRFSYYDDYLAGVIKCDQVKLKRRS